MSFQLLNRFNAIYFDLDVIFIFLKMRYLKIRRWFLPCERRYIECKSCGLLRVLLEVLQTLESNGNVCSSFSNTQCLFSDNFKKKLTSTNNFYTAKSVAGLHLSKVSAKVRIRHFTTQVFFFFKSWHRSGYMHIAHVWLTDRRTSEPRDQTPGIPSRVR